MKHRCQKRSLSEVRYPQSRRCFPSWQKFRPCEHSIAGLSVGVYVQARLNHRPDLRPAIMRGDRTGARVSRGYIPRRFIFQWSLQRTSSQSCAEKREDATLEDYLITNRMIPVSLARESNTVAAVASSAISPIDVSRIFCVFVKWEMNTPRFRRIDFPLETTSGLATRAVAKENDNEHPSNDEQWPDSGRVAQRSPRCEREKQFASLFAQRCDPGNVGRHEPLSRADHKQNRERYSQQLLYPLCTCRAPSTPNIRARVGNRSEKSAVHRTWRHFCSRHIARLLFLSPALPFFPPRRQFFHIRERP